MAINIVFYVVYNNKIITTLKFYIIKSVFLIAKNRDKSQKMGY